MTKCKNSKLWKQQAGLVYNGSKEKSLPTWILHIM